MNNHAATVKHLVREIFHTHFLNKTDICKIMDIGVSTLRSWEAGDSRPSKADIVALELLLKQGYL